MRSTPPTDPRTPERAVTVASPAQAEPVGDQTRGLRRRIAYILMSAYALLMFVPFAWTLITSFKTRPDALRATIIPDPVTFAGW